MIPTIPQPRLHSNPLIPISVSHESFSLKSSSSSSHGLTYTAMVPTACNFIQQLHSGWMKPPKMLIPRTCGCYLVQKKGGGGAVLCRCNDIKDPEIRRSSWVMQVDPKSNERPQKGHTQDTQGRWCDDRVSDLNDVTASQRGEEEGTWPRGQRGQWCDHQSRNAYSNKKLEEAKNSFSPGTLGRVQLCWHLDFRLLTSRTMRK